MARSLLIRYSSSTYSRIRLLLDERTRYRNNLGHIHPVTMDTTTKVRAPSLLVSYLCTRIPSGHIMLIERTIKGCGLDCERIIEPKYSRECIGMKREPKCVGLVLTIIISDPHPNANISAQLCRGHSNPNLCH